MRLVSHISLYPCFPVSQVSLHLMYLCIPCNIEKLGGPGNEASISCIPVSLVSLHLMYLCIPCNIEKSGGPRDEASISCIPVSPFPCIPSSYPYISCISVSHVTLKNQEGWERG